MSELYSFSKVTRFFRKPLYQPSPNADPAIPFMNAKFKSDDTKKFFIGMDGMCKAKKDNVLTQMVYLVLGNIEYSFIFFLIYNFIIII